MTNEGILAHKLETLHGDVVEMKQALNKLSEAITKLALVEQQQNQIAQALDRAFKTISKIETRVAALEQEAPKGKETSQWVDRLILGAVMLAAGAIGSKLGIAFSF